MVFFILVDYPHVQQFYFQIMTHFNELRVKTSAYMLWKRGADVIESTATAEELTLLMGMERQLRSWEY